MSNNAPATQNNSPVAVLKNVLDKPTVQEQFQNAMGKNTPVFLASIVDVFASDNNLQQCNPNSVVMEALKAATLNLPINKNLGFAYIVPYKGRAQMQIGYKGYLQLAMRSGQYKQINTGTVYEGELKKHDKLTGEIDLSGEATSDNVIGYFAYLETVSGFRKTLYWTKAQVTRHAEKYSQSYKNKYSPWQTSFDEMAKKTVLKQLLSRYGVMSVEMVQALQEESETGAVLEQEQCANGEYIDIQTGEVLEAETMPEPEPEVQQPEPEQTQSQEQTKPQPAQQSAPQPEF